MTATPYTAEPTANASVIAQRFRRVGLLIVLVIVMIHGLDVYVRHHGGDRSPFVPLLTVLSVAAGVALIVLGLRLGLSFELRWWRLLALPCVAVGLFWSALPLAWAWLAVNPPAVRAGESTPASVGLAFEEAALLTGDGVPLAGWYVPSTNGAALLLLPGAMSARHTLLHHARVLAEAGYGVLIVDARGHGASEGKAMEYGWFGDRDVAAAIDWLARRPDVKAGRIAALGLSMGGEEALTSAAKDRRIRCVIAEGATHRTYEDVRRTLGGVNVALGVPQYRALFGTVDLLTQARPPIPLEVAVADIAPAPVLLLNTRSEREFARRYHAAAPATTTLWEPASERHTGSLAEQPDAWERHVLAFLDASL